MPSDGNLTWRLLRTQRSAATSLLFRRQLDHLRLPLLPLLSITTGKKHPDFPLTLLQYHILTEEKLDSLAHFYHQRTPSVYSLEYPAPVIVSWNSQSTIEEKRRRFGRFIGLRGCESPEADDSLPSSEQLEIDRWIQQRIQQEVDRERALEAWKSKGF